MSTKTTFTFDQNAIEYVNRLLKGENISHDQIRGFLFKNRRNSQRVINIMNVFNHTCVKPYHSDKSGCPFYGLIFDNDENLRKNVLKHLTLTHGMIFEKLSKVSEKDKMYCKNVLYNSEVYRKEIIENPPPFEKVFTIPDYIIKIDEIFAVSYSNKSAAPVVEEAKRNTGAITYAKILTGKKENIDRESTTNAASVQETPADVVIQEEQNIETPQEEQIGGDIGGEFEGINNGYTELRKSDYVDNEEQTSSDLYDVKLYFEDSLANLLMTQANILRKLASGKELTPEEFAILNNLAGVTFNDNQTILDSMKNLCAVVGDMYAKIEQLSNKLDRLLSDKK